MTPVQLAEIEAEARGECGMCLRLVAEVRRLQVEVDEVHDDRLRVMAERDALLAVIAVAEWGGALPDEPYRACPWCGVEHEFHPSNQQPHKADCRAFGRQALAAHPAPAKPPDTVAVPRELLLELEARLPVLCDERHDPKECTVAKLRSRVRALLEGKLERAQRQNPPRKRAKP